jgi:urease accessory protein
MKPGGDRPAAGLDIARTLQFGDSMFPVGAFAFSGGLESAVQKGVVSDVATLEAFTRTVLEQAARGDAVALAHAHRAAAAGDLDALAAIDAAVYARKLSAEARTMSVRMGRKLAETAARVVEEPLPAAWRDRILGGTTPGCHPVALAVVFAAQRLDARHAFVVHQYGVATMVLGAALRTLRVSHLDTQAILHRVTAAVDDDYAVAASTALDDMAGFAPLAEILAAVHVRAHVRLFMN